ncbi:MAG: hotdog fold thioesterase [Polyangia bacterium]
MPLPPDFARLAMEAIPFHRWLGLRIASGSVDGAHTEGYTHAVLPFRDELVGDPRRPALHGGILAAVLDACGGFAVWSACDLAEDRVSTIDMRIDYLKHAGPEPLVAEAHLVRLGNRVGVVDMRCWQASAPDTLVATAKGVYNVRRKGS